MMGTILKGSRQCVAGDTSDGKLKQLKIRR